MSHLINTIRWLCYYTVLIRTNIDCQLVMQEMYYQGISITWRRLLSSKSNVIHFEIIISLALSDRTYNPCDSHHSKPDETLSQFEIICIDSWNNCTSWSSNNSYIECYSKFHGNSFLSLRTSD